METTIQIWHPHPKTGDWMDLCQVYESDVCRYYIDGKLVKVVRRGNNNEW